MKIAIVDDNKTEAMALKKIIIRRVQDEGICLQCHSYYGGEEFLKRVNKISSSGQEPYTIVFINININGIGGIQTALELRQINRSCLIILLASDSAHMSDAFTLHAFDYLIRPVDDRNISRVLSDALLALPTKEPYLVLPMGKQSIPVLYEDIIYATSDANYSLIVSSNEYRCRIPFHKIEAALSHDDRFLTINRGILVNLHYVVEMEGSVCIMQNGKTFPLNTRKRTLLKQRLIDYRFK